MGIYPRRRFSKFGGELGILEKKIDISKETADFHRPVSDGEALVRLPPLVARDVREIHEEGQGHGSGDDSTKKEKTPPDGEKGSGSGGDGSDNKEKKAGKHKPWIGIDGINSEKPSVRDVIIISLVGIGTVLGLRALYRRWKNRKSK